MTHLGVVCGLHTPRPIEKDSRHAVISKVVGAAENTFSCVLDCSWAYGAAGNIIDLRDPSNPKLMKMKWTYGTPARRGGHDVEEVAPGLVMTATDPMMLLDARKYPASPRVIAVARPSEYGPDRPVGYVGMHGTRWPREMKDRFLLAASETTMNGRCGKGDGSFQTWDATKWKRTKTFTMIDEYRVVNGVVADGNPPAQRNCTAHWFEEHPDFHNGGFVAVAYFDHGSRFFEVTSKGKIKEAGYFYAYAGEASAAYWITDEIVYVVDYQRGLDILRFTPPDS